MKNYNEYRQVVVWSIVRTKNTGRRAADDSGGNHLSSKALTWMDSCVEQGLGDRTDVGLGRKGVAMLLTQHE